MVRDILRLLRKKTFEAPIWSRIGSYLFDLIIVNFIVTVPFNKFLTANLPITQSITEIQKYLTANPEKMLIISIAAILMAIISILYWAALEYNLGQSVGELLFRLKIKSGTKTLNFWQCFVANISKPFPLVFLVDLIYLSLIKQNQRYFEKLAGLELVKEI